MADTITTSKELAIGIDMGYKVTMKIPNYKTTLTEEQIKNAFENQDVIIYHQDEDPSQTQAVTPEQVYTASTTNQTINNIDIGWE